MPLPNLNRRCTAIAKSTGKRCACPAKYPLQGRAGGVCRLHGWRAATTVRSGADHWNFQTGEGSVQAKRYTAETLRELKRLEVQMKKTGIIK
jgi:hypothetical protein